MLFISTWYKQYFRWTKKCAVFFCYVWPCLGKLSTNMWFCLRQQGTQWMSQFLSENLWNEKIKASCVLMKKEMCLFLQFDPWSTIKRTPHFIICPKSHFPGVIHLSDSNRGWIITFVSFKEQNQSGPPEPSKISYLYIPLFSILTPWTKLQCHCSATVSSHKTQMCHLWCLQRQNQPFFHI